VAGLSFFDFGQPNFKNGDLNPERLKLRPKWQGFCETEPVSGTILDSSDSTIKDL
jgi:hypothetical protein